MFNNARCRDLKGEIVNLVLHGGTTLNRVVVKDCGGESLTIEIDGQRVPILYKRIKQLARINPTCSGSAGGNRQGR